VTSVQRSTARPRQSKPGPMLADVAGTRTVTDRRGCEFSSSMVIRAAMRRRIRSSWEWGKRSVASEEAASAGSWKMKEVRVGGEAVGGCLRRRWRWYERRAPREAERRAVAASLAVSLLLLLLMVQEVTGGESTVMVEGKLSSTTSS
jgi:hypothetical protein